MSANAGADALRAFAIFLIFSFNASSDEAAACSCAAPPPPVAALLESAAVFEGKVVDITEEPYEIDTPSGEHTGELNLIRFRVLRAWKGVLNPEVIVTTHSQSGMCGFHFETGGRYLVYARWSRGRLSTSICTRTASAARAHEDFRDLGPARWQGAP